MLVGAYLERGFKDVGKDAELEEAGRVLKRTLIGEGNRILSSDVFELDTAEELYRVRAGKDEAQDVLSKIERLKRDGGPDAQDLQRAIVRYQKAFEEFSIAQRRIGATDSDGIHGELRNIAVELNRLVEGAVGRAALSAEQAHARFVTVTAIAMVPTFALGAALFLSFARTLNSRIRLLLEATGRVRQGDLTTPIASARGTGFAQGNIGDELTVLIDGFNEMMSQIATRDRALDESHHQLAERILQLQRAEGQLREALQRATESDRLKSAFLTNMSHEVRTPLNIILGYNSLIAERLAELHDNDLDPHLEAVSSASLRLISTIQGIIDLSRLETGTFEVRRKPVNLSPLVEAAVHHSSQPAAQKQLSLTCKIEVSEAAALVDEYCLKESIRLLLDNAIKFTERGDVTVHLCGAPNGIVVLTIRDTGIGIDPNYLPNLFKPFSQERVDSTRPFEGPGIGLALVKRYLDRCQVEISVQSERGKGTAFTIRLPTTAERSSDDSFNQGPALNTVRAIHETKPLVLVVEDDDLSREYVATILRNHFDTLLAANGGQARAHFAKHPGKIAVILMDLSLASDEDGFMLCRWLRADPRWKNVPIIATTAFAQPEDQRNAMAAGYTAYLAKPFSRAALLRVIGQALDGAPSTI